MSARAASQSKKAGNGRSSANGSAERKRRASSSSVSSVSSVSSLEDLSDEADDSEDDADDEEDRPLARAPPYGRHQNNDRKAGRQPAKNKRRRVPDDDFSNGPFSSDASDSDESSDDVYAAVDYITDADDEEGDVEKLEELMIMESEKDHRILPSSETTHEQWTASEMFGDSMLLPAASFFDEEQLYSAMGTFGEADVASEAVETPVPRRVHFEERSDSSSDSESHTDDEIPGDFLQQDALDPQLRRMIENDNDHHRSHRRQSEEIFGDTDYGHGNIYHIESDGTSEGSLSGYESMLATCSPFPFAYANPFQPMMAIRPMKTCPRQQPSLTPAPSFAETPLTRWPPWAMTRTTVCHAAGVPSWERSWLTLTSPSPWLIARANTSLSFLPMPPLAMTGWILPQTACLAPPTTVLARLPCS